MAGWLCGWLAGGSWDRFAELMAATPPGNGGVLGFHLGFPEITPPITTTGEFYFDAEAGTPRDADTVSDAQKVCVCVCAGCLGNTATFW